VTALELFKERADEQENRSKGRAKTDRVGRQLSG